MSLDRGPAHLLAIVNWLLALVVAAFLFQILGEMLFPDRGKFCVGCGVRDLPRTFSTCDHCGLELATYVEKVGRRERLIAYLFPLATLVLTAAACRELGGAGYTAQAFVALFVVINCGFSVVWLTGRDPRLRTLFNVPFWTAVCLTAVVIAFDMTVRMAVSDGEGAGARMVADMEVGADGVPCLAMRDGSLAHGIGTLAHAYFRGIPVRRLIRGGNGDLLVYTQSRQLNSPDAIVGASGVLFDPPRSRVDTAVSLVIGTTPLSPAQRSTLDRATHQWGVDFCSAGDRLWVIDGATLYRIHPDGAMDALSLGQRAVGRLLKVAPGDRCVYVLSTNGLTRVNLATSRKEYYALSEYAGRPGQPLAEIVAGAVHGAKLWFATASGDVLSFDLAKERLQYEGAAACPAYVDFYNAFTLPILLLALVWTLRANFRSARE